VGSYGQLFPSLGQLSVACLELLNASE